MSAWRLRFDPAQKRDWHGRWAIGDELSKAVAAMNAKGRWKLRVLPMLNLQRLTDEQLDKHIGELTSKLDANHPEALNAAMDEWQRRKARQRKQIDSLIASAKQQTKQFA